MTVELLYFDGCPSYQRLLPRLAELASAAGVQLELHRIDTFEAAERKRFLGSPTVRVDGHDIEPGADQRRDYGLKCRLYRWQGQQTPLPPDEWITRALTGRGDK